ncbi:MULTISPECIES: NUDIX domain-containing protein [unclassified Meridianimarinicoccus]|uniref:NUDIX domain-containing protein n=1 Tax=unclassified Meridianimarinicoccus TaxID=2923344 RepID=UPI0018681122|nr:NUDIX hydrolase [Fluviibacterium sp. MJW13]
MRRYGDPVDGSRRHVARPGVYAILARGDQVLLTHQMAPVPEFQLPGGGIDPGEQPLCALYREVFEETGWHIGRATRFDAHRRFTFMPEYDIWAEKICLIYVARPARAVAPPPEAGHTAVWLPVDTAAKLVGSPGDRAALRRYARKIGL